MTTHWVRLISGLLCCCVIVSLPACSGVSKPPWQAEGYGDKNPAENAHRVVWADETLKRHDIIRVSEITPDWTDDGRLEVYCKLVNRSADDLVIQVQTAFKDGRNRERETTPWLTVVLPATSGKAYTVQSVRSDVKDYLVRIRLAAPAAVYK